MTGFYASRIDAKYTVEYMPANFGLPPALGRVLSEMHKRLSPFVEVPLNNLGAMNGTNFAEIGASVQLYGGLVTIEATAGKFEVHAERLVGSEDIEKVVNCTQIAFSVIEDQISESNSDALPSKSILAVDVWLQDDENKRGRQILLDRAPSYMKEKYGPSLGEFRPGYRLDDKENGIATDIFLEPSVLSSGGIFCKLRVYSGLKHPPVALDVLQKKAELGLSDALELHSISLRSST